jgi:nicotinamidase-related amidase
MDVMTFRMPRLIQASREAGLLVAHVGVSADYHKSGDIWESCQKEAGEPPPQDAESVRRDWRSQHAKDVFDSPKAKPEVVPEHPFSLPEVFTPTGNDIIAEHAWQLHRLLENRGINHILYTGWALNWCLWFSPCGMSDMGRKGYMCSAIRGGCVAIENRESAVGERNLEYALWKTSTMFGYVFELHELTHALRESSTS